MLARKWYVLILGLWFVLWGILNISTFNFTGSGVVLSVMAIIGGILWWLDR